MEFMHQATTRSGINGSKIIICGPCNYDEKVAMADTFCMDCNQHLCPQCRHFHTKFLATRTHRIIKPQAQQNNEPKELVLKLCDTHRSNEVKYYCETHEGVICTICMASTHSSCNLQPITGIMNYETDKRHLAMGKDSIKELTMQFQNSLQSSSKCLSDIEKIANDYRVKLSNMKDKVCSLLDQATTSISLKVEEAKARCALETDTDKSALYSDAVNDLENLIRNIQDVQDSNDPVAIFSAKFKAAKLFDEYSFIEKKHKSIYMDFIKDIQMIDTFENCLMTSEFCIKQTTEDVGFQTQTNRVQGHHVNYESNFQQVYQENQNANLDTKQTKMVEEVVIHQRYPHTHSSDGMEAMTDVHTSSLGPIGTRLQVSGEPLHGTKPKQVDTSAQAGTASDSHPGISFFYDPFNDQGIHEAPASDVLYNNLTTEVTKPEPMIAKHGAVASPETRDAKPSEPPAKARLYSSIVKESSLKSFRNLKFSKAESKVVRMPRDEGYCDITGSTFLPDGRVILCDHKNKSLKLLNQSFKIVGSLQMKSKPWDITAITDTEVAVTIPMTQTVQFFEVFDDKLVESRNFRVKQHVWGIDSFRDTVIISIHDFKRTAGTIQIRQHNGALIKEIKMDSKNKLYFKSPEYVTVDKRDGKIFVSDGKENAIFHLNSDGTFVRQFEQKDLRGPCKIVSDLENNLIVCVFSSNSLKILPLKETETAKYGIFYDSCQAPQTISYKEDEKMFIVGRHLNDEILILKYTNNE